MGGQRLKQALQRTRFYSSVGVVYASTLLFAASCLSLGPFAKVAPVFAHTTPVLPTVTVMAKTYGTPNRLLLPHIGLELPIDPGMYDEANQTWTLSGNHAHYAMASVVPNDYQGNTLIYGHNHWWVFGKLKLLQPGDQLQIFTDNGHQFTYTYQNFADYQPNDPTIFRYDGPPTVTLQTCGGNWNEIRRMYEFKLQEAR